MRQGLRFVLEWSVPALCILLPAWFNPFSATPFEPAKVALFQLVSAGMILAALGSLLLDLSRRTPFTYFRHQIESLRVRNPCALPVLAFALVGALATLTSIDWRLSIWGSGETPGGFITALCAAGLFLIVAQVLTANDQINRVLDSLLLGSIPVAVYGLIQYVGLDPLDWIANPISPSFSTMGNANYLGAYLGMLVPISIARVVQSQSNKRKLKYTIVVLFQVVCLWLTLARGAWLGLMGGTLVYFAILGRRWHSRTLRMALLLFLLIGAGLFIGMSNAVLRPWLKKSTQRSEETSLPPAKIDTASLQVRSVVWQDTLRLLADRWLLGYGPGTFALVFQSKYPYALENIEGAAASSFDPHNLVLRQLMDSGLLGLGAFIWIVVAFYALTFYKLAQSVDRQTDATLAAISGSATAFLIQAQFNPTVITLFFLFWLDLALVVAYGRNASIHSVGQTFTSLKSS